MLPPLPQLQQLPTKITHQYVYGPLRNLLLGASLCYSIEKGNYHHIPIVWFFPSIYAGYQTYSNRDSIVSYLKTEFKSMN